jgi:hypothetical protein
MRLTGRAKYRRLVSSDQVVLGIVLYWAPRTQYPSVPDSRQAGLMPVLDGSW